MVLDVCKQIIQKEPSFAPAYNNMALAYFEKGEFAKAVQYADEAQKLGFEVAPQFLEELKPHRS
jgi:tetratricopeptide (TPR) repeat protein